MNTRQILLLWAALLYSETITPWILTGTGLFIVGIILVNMKGSILQSR